MGRTACTEPQCLYKGALFFTCVMLSNAGVFLLPVCSFGLSVFCKHLKIDVLVYVRCQVQMTGTDVYLPSPIFRVIFRKKKTVFTKS